MGLDMMLNKKVYIGAQYEHRNITGNVEIFKDGKRLDLGMKNLEYLEYEVVYWRKANAIHAWFVKNAQNNVDDCGTYEVSQEQLQELVDTCKKALSALENAGKIRIENRNVLVLGEGGGQKTEPVDIYDPLVVADIMPTQGGFFFGGTEINDWYIDNLKTTITAIESELETSKGDESVYYTYHSSW